VTLPYHFYKLKKDTQLLGDEDCWKYNGMEAGKQEDVYLAPQLQLRWGSALERIFMTLGLQTVIEAVHALPLSEKLEVLQALSDELSQLYTLEAGSTAFWSPKTLEELSVAQPAPIVTDVRTLASDFWLEEESAEDLNRFIAEQRHRDREA
jgi:hypothetical protein